MMAVANYPLLVLFALLSAHCSGAKYVAPNWRIPGLAARDVPQMILLTHDDGVTNVALKAITAITKQHKNPNGCTIPGVFFTTAVGSDCKAVKALWNIGHEIAGHTMTHVDLQKASTSQRRKELQGLRDWAANKCGIPKSDVVGHRSPYLLDNAEVRAVLRETGYKYDYTIREIYPSPTSPSASKRLFPYSFDKGNPQTYSCHFFSNNNGCTKTERHAGMMEIPMNIYQKGPSSSATFDAMDPPNPYAILKREFDRNYNANRAPLGIWGHTSTGYFTKEAIRNEISKFLSYALSKKDVWVVTSRQLMDYMQDPVPASKMGQFLAKYKCSKTGIPRMAL